MQLLFVANRHERREAMREWLGGGLILLCDRYRASSIAYGEAQGLDPQWLEDIQRFLPPADFTVYLDIEPATAAARGPHGRDRYRRDLALLSRVRDSYKQRSRPPGRTGSRSTAGARRGHRRDVFTAVRSRLGLPRCRPLGQPWVHGQRQHFQFRRCPRQHIPRP